MGGRLGNGPAGQGVVHGRLREKIGAASDIRGMKEPVIFEGEIGMNIFARKPFADGASIDERAVPAVLRRREGVHHVFEGLVIPGGRMGVLGKHIGRERKTNDVPAILLGLRVARGSRRRFVPEKLLDSEARMRSTSFCNPASSLSQISHAPMPSVPVHMADCQLPPQGFPSGHFSVPLRCVATAKRSAAVDFFRKSWRSGAVRASEYFKSAPQVKTMPEMARTPLFIWSLRPLPQRPARGSKDEFVQNRSAWRQASRMMLV